MSNVEQLADFPAIKQIAGALWKTGETRGAAVMVGAGFSVNATLAANNAKRPPLWQDFCEEMSKQLYPNGGGPSDPLRLAEEFRAVLGQAALDGLIFDLVRDSEWLPGPLHHRLLGLPWSDVLTTNWDTLLERAAETNVHQFYETVRAIADIPRTRAPRIVKLHGSLPSNRPFIFAEEDFRTYPVKFAPYVNLAQQVLLENELCLLGFSGDDPNFLHWSGWVRDQLGAAARRIYIVGALNINPARRKFLESRNVLAIDLWPLVKEQDSSNRHGRAIELFIDYLAAAKPRPVHEWPRERSVSRTQNPSLQEKAIAWRLDRESYPGWLACPRGKRISVRYDTELDHTFDAQLKGIDASARGQLIYELAWRFEIAFIPLTDGLRDSLIEAIQDARGGIGSAQILHLALMLLKDARERGDATAFDKWALFVEGKAEGIEDALAALAYERCLWTRNNLDYAKLPALIATIRGTDPAWQMRRAGLHCDLGDFRAARAVLEGAMRDLRDRYARDRKSLWVLSRLAWATYFARALSFGATPKHDPSDPFLGRDWPNVFRSNLSDPWDELQSLDAAVDEAYREKIKSALSKEPKFEAGTYQDHARAIRFVSPLSISPADEVAGVADWVGLPATADHVDVIGARRRRAFDLIEDHSKVQTLHCIRVARSHSDPLVEKWFSRIAVARMSQDVVADLAERLWKLIDFGVARFHSEDGGTGIFWVEEVRLYTELASRLVLRASSVEAGTSFRRASGYLKDQRWAHWWLLEPLSHLLQRSLEALWTAERHAATLTGLDFP